MDLIRLALEILLDHLIARLSSVRLPVFLS
jgi:hypothetical protein